MINQYEGACIVNNTGLTISLKIFHLKFKLHLEETFVLLLIHT